jgi:ferric-dicitrate binding protein FerR (iron transport regulator)
MLASRLEYLFNCYVQQNCSEKEEEELMHLLSASENEAEVKKLLDKVVENTGAEASMPDETAGSILRRILEKDKAVVVPIKKDRHVFFLLRRVAAAVVILFISGAVYWLLSNRHNEKTAPVALSSVKSSTVLPGGNHAILTLADGTRIVLDSVQNGNIKGGVATIKKQGATIVYDASSGAKNHGPVVYNTLTTPRGGQYQLILPDGSKVWLNASSSIHFPTAFTGNQRDVELTGEAYFEIAKNKRKPFHVNVKGMQVEVLGTHFNVNAYGDENDIKTTLLEGLVKVKKAASPNSVAQTVLIQPGEQANLAKDGSLKINRRPDLEEVVAWKEGNFEFTNASIPAIMRQVSRWYNVEVAYEGAIPRRQFTGKISRSVNLNQLIGMLQYTGVNMKIQDKEIIISAN